VLSTSERDSWREKEEYDLKKGQKLSPAMAFAPSAFLAVTMPFAAASDPLMVMPLMGNLTELGCVAGLVAGCYSHWRWNGWIQDSPTALHEITTKPIMTGLGFGARVTLVTPALTGLALWLGLPLLSGFTDVLYHGLAGEYVVYKGAEALFPWLVGALPVTLMGGLFATPFVALTSLPIGCGAGVLFTTWYKQYVIKRPPQKSTTGY
jgi:hypothetical protein